MASLPTVGGSAGTWGTLLNEFLGVGHTSTGITKVNAVYANTYLGTNQSIPTGTITQIAFDTVNFQSSTGIIDTTNHKITPGESGIYLIMGSICFASVVPGVIEGLYLYKNGSSLISSTAYSMGTTMAPKVNVIALASLNNTDYLTMSFYHNKGSAASLYSGDSNTWLAAIKISEVAS